MAPPVAPLEHRYRGEHPVRTLVWLLRPDRWRIALAFVVFTVKHSPVWLLPLTTAAIVDTVVDHLPIGNLWSSAGLVLAILLVNLPLHLLWVRLMYGSVRRMGTALRSALCTRMQQLSIGYHHRVSAGVLQAKVVRDVETIEQMVQQTSEMGLGAGTVLIGGLVIIGLRAPEFLPIFLVVVPCAALLVMRMRLRLRTRNEHFRRDIEQLSTRVAEMTRLISVTRAHGLEDSALRRMNGTLRRVLDSAMRLDLLNGRVASASWVLLNILGLSFLTGAALVAYYEVWDVSAGDVVMLSAFLATLTNSTTTLLSLMPVVTKGLESVRSVGEVLQAPALEENEGKAEVTAVRGAFTFDEVSFGYEGDERRPAVSRLSLTVSPGETIALVGASGAGKSTVLNLLIGFERPTRGRLLLDGVDMGALDLRTYRRFVSVVPQESILFEGTVRENVAYGMDDADEGTVREALAAANALEFVDRLPGGLDAVVGEHGARLSGGQRQRLAIARALIRDPRVLILDEATSALDTRSEALVQQALSRLVRGRTTFVVAHRLSTIRGADRIVVLDHGEIVESGTHEELLARGGAYAALTVGQLN
ncbi:ATP-binding cassette domain-containing protein [Streptomyces sp. 3MP-14]|uniref:ATP-binding cassette domain-containing protein n=1 Tax=Streptomyces mimosae TaxID=2586635 RepID=A0A5N6AJF1_9ACTN|nr:MULTISPECIES: ABC transporter ATP-binding protein [Streptomyces]KAB8167688.1 ATP-binding cassette domain-containing protein [Streptomyces mimosae]KAB8177664.1 ATP-binding cassette domain-containing protein [Streptomyces sp. 3MP-14]